MAHGLQVFDANGNRILDTTTRCGRVIGLANTGTSNGSFNVGSLPPGSVLWASLLSPDIGAPGITSSGTTVSWTFSAELTPRASYIIYGIF